MTELSSRFGVSQSDDPDRWIELAGLFDFENLCVRGSGGLAAAGGSSRMLEPFTRVDQVAAGRVPLVVGAALVRAEVRAADYECGFFRVRDYVRRRCCHASLGSRCFPLETPDGTSGPGGIRTLFTAALGVSLRADW